MTLRRITLPTVIAAAALLAACSSPVKLDEPKPATPAPVTNAGAAATTGGAQSQATPQSQVATVDLERQRAEAEAAARAAAALANLPRVVYFDFDSFLLRAEDRPVLEGYAKALVAQRDRRMALEGHADERGGREYNLALGQKRAESVARALELLGVNAAQLEAVSFGEERPAEAGSNEAAWAKNRRVELKDR
jgi:peptidoglycan-associated lipoprotein